MVSQESVNDQLKRLNFKTRLWSAPEVQELHNILMPDEEIYECVMGSYEGGFALLLASNFRVLLVDKKPLNYLTVEDLRFDMINEIDYSHRMMGASITIATGSKTLRFRSYNQLRLRKLITHVQHYMAESKNQQQHHQAGQNQHLEQINQQLQEYLVAQQKQQEELAKQLEEAKIQGVAVQQPIQPIRPDPQLADYLYAQSLLRNFGPQAQVAAQPLQQSTSTQTLEPAPVAPGISRDAQLRELYAEGMQEIFGKHTSTPPPEPVQVVTQQVAPVAPITAEQDTSALRIAYSKLPMALRNRKFGRPSFHAHSKAAPRLPGTPVPTPSE